MLGTKTVFNFRVFLWKCLHRWMTIPYLKIWNLKCCKIYNLLSIQNAGEKSRESENLEIDFFGQISLRRLIPKQLQLPWDAERASGWSGRSFLGTGGEDNWACTEAWEWSSVSWQGKALWDISASPFGRLKLTVLVKYRCIMLPSYLVEATNGLSKPICFPRIKSPCLCSA